MKITKLQLCPLVLICVIYLSACNQKNTSNTTNSTQQLETSEVTNDGKVEEDEIVAPNFEVSKDELINKIESSSNYKKSDDTNGSTVKYIYVKGDVEVNLHVQDGSDEYNALSIIDRKSKEQNYKSVYQEILGFLGISTDADQLEEIEDEQEQVENVWVKCYSEGNEMTVIINSYQE